MFRDRYAQPICLTDYRDDHARPSPTPVTNLFLTDSCQLHPHDRTISGIFGLGSQAARRAARVGARNPMRPCRSTAGRAVVLGGALVPPLAFVVTARVLGAALVAVASILAIAVGLAVLERAVRADGGLASVSVAASLLALYGTGLLWHAGWSRAALAFAFVAGTLLVRAWGERAGGRGTARSPAARRWERLWPGSRFSPTWWRDGGRPCARPLAALDSLLLVAPRPLLLGAGALTIAGLGLSLRAARGHRAALGALAALVVLALVNAGLRPWWSGALR